MTPRPLLILDLDETLLWATPNEPPTHDFRAFHYYVTKRPHLDVFLASAFDWFDVAVWTSSGEHYAEAVVDRLLDMFGTADLHD